MSIPAQVRLVHWSIIASALLLAIASALSWAALENLASLHLKLVSENQIERAHVDILNSFYSAGGSALVLAVIAVALRKPSSQARAAVWVVAPIIALTTLCFLVGGPEYAVAPTGEEPAELQAEYAQVVPDWYTWSHGVTGVLAAALLIFGAVFLTRSDLREAYVNAGGTETRGYTSWVDRTGGAAADVTRDEARGTSGERSRDDGVEPRG
ncbi:hypothetical protein ACQP00_34700 [Dactylosporangium sp. CS-047395]|uniref:hypothetical protein n=1 Tax=Dactylosporangium sp. CS-047395 TaxID=3239936 RepID=UPI003D8B8784